MIAALYSTHNFLRIATGILLVFAIGFKISVNAAMATKAATKQTSAAAGTADNDGEKKTENNTLPEKEFASIYTQSDIYFQHFITVVHNTIYINCYQNSYFNSITIPPPDLYLQPTV